MERVRQRYDDAVPVGDLRPHPLNANVGASAVIAESIRENSWYGAVYAHEGTGYIVAGNHRWEEAVKAGADTIPVIWLDVDERRASKILAVDNESSRKGRNDDAKLAALLESFAGDYAGTGYEEPDLNALLAKLRPVAPESFPAYGGDIATEHECPRCGYVWSGSSKPMASTEDE